MSVIWFPRVDPFEVTVAILGAAFFVGLSLVFGIDAAGNVVVRRQVKRRYVRHSFRSCHRAWSASKPALHRIIGHASSRHSAAPFA